MLQRAFGYEMQNRYMTCTWIANQRLKEKELISHGFNFKLTILLAVPTTFQIFRIILIEDVGLFRLCSFRVLGLSDRYFWKQVSWGKRNESEWRPAPRTLLALRSVSWPRISLGLLRRGTRRRWRVSRGQVTEGARARVFCPGDRAQERLHVLEGGGQMSYARSSYQLGKQHCRGLDAATWLTEKTALSCQLSFLTTDNSS